jgi:manganese transport system ATP-binding protein
MTRRIACSHLRVDVGGVPAVDGLTFASTGDHVLVLGAARALFEAAAGLRAVTRGELLVEDLGATQAVRAGVAACAPLDPPLPTRWTVLQYVAWSARLAGHGRRVSFELATDALARMQLTSLVKTKLAAAPVPVRRATVLAAALATGATTLLLEDPVLGLPEQAAYLLARAAARATSDRCTALFAGRVALESPMALAADETIVLDGSHVTAQGAPAEIATAERTLVLRVHGQVDAFQHAVEARGGRAVAAVGAAEPVYMRVELGPLSSRDLLLIAAQSDAVVVELRPLARPFA